MMILANYDKYLDYLQMNPMYSEGTARMTCWNFWMMIDKFIHSMFLYYLHEVAICSANLNLLQQNTYM